MSILKRIAYYLGGFGLGLGLLYFFVSGSGASCEYNYGPNSRALKNIRNKERVISEATLETLHKYQLDTSSISSLLRNGDVIFSESNTKLDSCKVYVIEGDVPSKEPEQNKKRLKITIENCDKKATVKDAVIIE